jgi:hypothetical protein
MAFDFPSNPTIGQEYNAGPLIYVWSGYGWTIKAMGDAPNDGNLYGRKSLAWSAAVAEAPNDSNLYGRKSLGWSALVDGSKRNHIVNGAMMISQENASTAGTSSGYYPVDQFQMIFTNAGTQGIQQVAVATPGGSPNRIRLTVSVADAAVAAGDYCAIRQTIEGNRWADLSGSNKTVTLQFGCKGPAGTYCVSLLNTFSNKCYVAEYVIAAGEANTDVVKSVSIPLALAGPWNIGNSGTVAVYWTFMVGTTNQTTPNAWQSGSAMGSANQFNFMGSTSNVFELFDVSLTDGTVAPPFVVPDYPSELLLCQRYWNYIYVNGRMNATGVNYLFETPIYYYPPMRASPTVIQKAGGSVANMAAGSPAVVSMTATAARLTLQAAAAGDMFALLVPFAMNARP